MSMLNPKGSGMVDSLRAAARFVLAIATLIAVQFFNDLARAEVRNFGSFRVDTNQSDVVELDGPIGVGAALDFRRALTAAPNAKLLVLNSPGGVVTIALLIADDVSQRGISTLIPAGSGCYSACSYVFLAGRERVVDGELGVHQISSDKPDLQSAQLTISDIIDVLNRFKTPIEVLTVMFRTPPNQMHVFSDQEIADYAIERHVGVSDTATMPAGPSQDFEHQDSQRAPRSSTATARAEPDLSIVEAFTKRPNRVAVYAGLDFFGGDLSSERVSDLSLCAGRCLETEGCRAFTFNADEQVVRGPNCFLKSELAQPDGNAVAISGVLLKRSEADPSPLVVGVIDPRLGLLRDIDLPSGDLSSRPVPGIASAGACRLTCVQTEACGAFTFVKHRGQCWLKSSAAGYRSAPGMVSGRKETTTFAPIRIIDLSR